MIEEAPMSDSQKAWSDRCDNLVKQNEELRAQAEQYKADWKACTAMNRELLAEIERLKQEQAEPVACVCKDRPYCNQECNPKTSPVAWRFQDPKDGHWLYTTHITDLSKKFWRLKNEVFEPLYTAPQGQTALLRQALESLEMDGHESGDDKTPCMGCLAIDAIKQHLGEA